MKVKTTNLTGPALRYAVAKCEGATDEWRAEGPFMWDGVPCVRVGARDVSYHPDTDWSQGGPIIERERIATDFDADPAEGGPCAASRRDDPCYWVGPTPLIAAMRCYVASKLGEEVEVPDELA